MIEFDAGQMVPYRTRTAARAEPPVSITSPTSIAAADGYLWVATLGGQLARFRADGQNPSFVPVGRVGNRLVAADDRSVWVVDEFGTVVAVDPQALDELSRLRLPGRLEDVALDSGGAWVVEKPPGKDALVARVVRTAPE